MNRWINKAWRAAACAAVLLSGSAAAVAGDRLYFADLFSPTYDHGSIRAVGADGDGLVDIAPIGGGLRGLDIDANAGKVYWCDVNTFAIRRSALDGSGVEDLITDGLEFPSMIRLDVEAKKMYWGDQTSAELWRANFDGTERELVRSTAFHRGIAIDPVGGYVYWSTSGTRFKGTIVRSRFDGTELKTIVSSTDEEFKPAAIALDAAGGKVYWTDYVVDVVRRANLDGSEIKDLYVVGSNRNPQGITLDLKNGKVYWGQDTDVDAAGGKIMRMNLDGTVIETVKTELGLINDIVLIHGSEETCRPDCNGDGKLNINDFICFQAQWRDKSAYGDYNGDGKWNINDFIAFQAEFRVGCP